MSGPRVLVAGIGNVFLGDDGFGVEVVRRLAESSLPPGVEVRDFGIRGFDLALALLEGHEQIVLVDAVKRGGKAGTLYLLEAETGSDAASAEFDVHGMVPSRVVRAAREMGDIVGRVLVVACEAEDFGEEDTGRMGLSGSVEAAVDEAVRMIDRLVRQASRGHETHA